MEPKTNHMEKYTEIENKTSNNNKTDAKINKNNDYESIKNKVMKK